MTPALTVERSTARRSPDQRQRLLIERVLRRDSAGTVRLLEAWVHRRGLASLEAFCRDAVPTLLSAADTAWLEACLHGPLERRVVQAEPAASSLADEALALPAVETLAPVESLAAPESPNTSEFLAPSEPLVASKPLVSSEPLGQGGDVDPSPLAASAAEWGVHSAPEPLAHEPQAALALESLAAPESVVASESLDTSEFLAPSEPLVASEPFAPLEPLGQGGDVDPSPMAASAAEWAAPAPSTPPGALNQGAGGWLGAVPEVQELQCPTAPISAPPSGAKASAPATRPEISSGSAALGEIGPLPKQPGQGQGLEQSLSAVGVVLADAPQRLRRKLFGSLGKARVLMRACIDEAISTLHLQAPTVSESESESVPEPELIAATPASTPAVGGPAAWPDEAMPLPSFQRAAGQPAAAPDPIDTAPAAAWSRSLASSLPVAASGDGALQGPPAPAALADLRAWLPGSSAVHDRRAS
ncbi:MAG: hypothetical protein ACK5N0_02020 [Synechococcaceae cyanobacterium]